MERAQEVLQQVVGYFQKVLQIFIDLFSALIKKDDKAEDGE